MRATAAALALAGLALGCGREELLHGVPEAQLNDALVALEEAGLEARAEREPGGEGGFRLEVRPADAARARRLLAELELPRARPPGFAEVFGHGGLVPTPAEERALYLQALSGELARSVESLGGVLAARVHLALPPLDPLRPEPPSPTRAAVLVRARPGAGGRVQALAPGIQVLVAGAVAGLDAAAVAVVVAEAPAASAPPPPPGWSLRRRVLAAAAALAVACAVAAAAAARPELRRLLRRRAR